RRARPVDGAGAPARHRDPRLADAAHGRLRDAGRPGAQRHAAAAGDRLHVAGAEPRPEALAGGGARHHAEARGVARRLDRAAARHRACEGGPVSASQMILNVDDTEGARYAKTRSLQHAGFEVVEAGTGADALRAAEQLRPALAVLDVHLPDMNGIEVCKI